MIYYDKINFSEEIDANKTSESKKYNIYYHWYFLNTGFKFQPNVCKRFHYLLMMSINLSDFGILNIKNADYHGIISRIRKWRP